MNTFAMVLGTVDTASEVVDLSGYIGALTGFGASDATTKGAWGALAKSVQASIDAGFMRDRVEAEMAMAEEEYKVANNVTSLPSAWRSAKSVALKAVEQGFSLFGDDGSVIGKTEAEREMSGKGKKTPYEKALEAANRLVKLSKELTATERETIRAVIGGF